MSDSTFDYQDALASCAQGDPQALQRLYTQEAPRMLALANIMLGDQVAAQNTVHDAFVLLWKNADSYDPRTGSARAWIYSIMRYRALSLLRRSPPALGPTATPSALPFYEDDAAGIAAALAKQPENARKPVLMAFYNGMNYADIAARLGCSTGELRNRVRACLRVLRECHPA
ncbi:sigma-70 family RNA polymerase sigma factor [Pusillimonas sp.]|uniref:sigma-70 family RNA polymerase sigma factor n=1 Tax=Pusillimonas sp. TaxID=3040095 RepID=UPI0037C57293